MRDLLAMMKALSNPNRLRIVSALNGHELCLCQIAELLGLVTSSASQHMSILQQARLVESQRHGRWTHFRLVGDDAPASDPGGHRSGPPGFAGGPPSARRRPAADADIAC